jgi:hypothetical protein
MSLLDYQATKRLCRNELPLLQQATTDRVFHLASEDEARFASQAPGMLSFLTAGFASHPAQANP